MNTSQAAYETLRPVMPSIKARAENAIAHAGLYGLTREEVVTQLGLPDENVQPRLSDLIRDGKIMKNGQTRINSKGNQENVYVSGDGRISETPDESVIRAQALIEEATSILFDYEGNRFNANDIGDVWDLMDEAKDKLTKIISV